MKMLIHLSKCFVEGSRRSFLAALQNPQQAQEECLRSIIQEAAKTEYGKHLGLVGTESYADFCKKVPCVSYETISPWIEKQRLSQSTNTFSPGTTRCYEPTSGSSGIKKLIPYNDAMLGSFSRLFKIWAADVLSETSAFHSGRFYFAVTPTPEQRLEAGQSLDDDASYVQGALQWLLRSRAAVPSTIKHIQASDDYFLVLGCCLLAAADLEAISIWNPSFFLQLLNYMEEHRERFLALLPSGSIEIAGKVYQWKRPSRRRMAALAAAQSWGEVWPHLLFLSCWDSARAGMSAARLRALLPKVRVQGKGLLATEAPLTVPIFSLGGQFPLVQDVFFEFKDAAGTLRRLHELAPEETYEVIITQRGGLLRYLLGDQVQAHASRTGTLSLSFIERTGQVVDLCGEKLHESALRETLAQAGADLTCFWLALPELPAHGRGQYTLVTDQLADTSAAVLEKQMLHLHHYALARKLKQLEPIRLLRHPEARRIFAADRAAQGIKVGALKSALLVRDLNLASHLLKVYSQV